MEPRLYLFPNLASRDQSCRLAPLQTSLSAEIDHFLSRAATNLPGLLADRFFQTNSSSSAVSTSSRAIAFTGRPHLQIYGRPFPSHTPTVKPGQTITSSPKPAITASKAIGISPPNRPQAQPWLCRHPPPGPRRFTLPRLLPRPLLNSPPHPPPCPPRCPPTRHSTPKAPPLRRLPSFGCPLK